MPGSGRFDRLPRAVMFGEQRLRPRLAAHARREARAVLARDQLRGHRIFEFDRVEVPTAGDAMDVLLVVVLVGLAAAGRSLLFPLREPFFALHQPFLHRVEGPITEMRHERNVLPSTEVLRPFVDI